MAHKLRRLVDARLADGEAWKPHGPDHWCVSATASIDEAARRPTHRLVADDDGIARAATLLREGGLAAFPTETVYGLGTDATNPHAVASLYAAKGRPRFNPLIAHLPDAETARRHGAFDANAARLAQAFWPGPLTLVVPLAQGSSICDLARAGLSSVALRVPAHPVAQALLYEVGRPVVAPSANRSGRISPTSAEHVSATLDGRIDAVLDGGRTPIGLESTIVGCIGSQATFLRAGGVPREAIEAVLEHKLGIVGGEERPVAPGALLSHYAPRARVRLNAGSIEPGEAALLFGGPLAGSDNAVGQLDLSPTADLAEAAANLFGHLHDLDASGAAVIAVAPIPQAGLGEAINDRLCRAAAER